MSSSVQAELCAQFSMMRCPQWTDNTTHCDTLLHHAHYLTAQEATAQALTNLGLTGPRVGADGAHCYTATQRHLFWCTYMCAGTLPAEQLAGLLGFNLLLRRVYTASVCVKELQTRFHCLLAARK